MKRYADQFTGWNPGYIAFVPDTADVDTIGRIRGGRAVAIDMRGHMKLRAALGGRCSGCGNDDPRVLQIDHIHGGGGADRKNGRMAILNKAIAGDPSLQLLCANCHCIKTFENGDHLTKTGDR